MTRSPSQATAAGAGKSPTTTPTSTKRKVKRQRVDKEEEGAVAVRTDMQAPPTNTKMPALADMQHYAHDHADKDEVISICSWNVNSLGAALKKGFSTYVEAEQADVLCLQETKCNSVEDAEKLKAVSSKRYPYAFWNCGTTRKGYAGSAILSRVKPLRVIYGFADRIVDGSNKPIPTALANIAKDAEWLEDEEGRVLTMELDDFYVVACYVPNAGMKLERLEWKCEQWNETMRGFLKHLNASKPVIWAGDLNVAVDDLDLARPKENRNKTPGFTDAERESHRTTMVDLDLVDAWRHLRGADAQRFTYFSYRFNCRAKNLGWRLDYFAVPRAMVEQGRLVECMVREEAYGASDHVPLVLVVRKGKAAVAK